MKKKIYLDYASTTPTDPKVVKAMEPYWNTYYGNPSSLYQLGLKSKEAISQAKIKISKLLNCQTDEIIFTGGGTESVNLALKGVMNKIEAGHMITSSIEHHAVLHTADSLKKSGQAISILPVDAEGLIKLSDIETAIQDNTRLISIMIANNEIGVIQDIQKIGALIEKINKARAKKALPRIYFHTDACQASGTLDLDVKKLHVDLMTINGSKIYGPKGVGLLYIKTGTIIRAIIDGGGQEKNLRSGTENVPGIVGLATALELTNQTKHKENARLTKLRDQLITGILKTIPKTILNGHTTKRLPNNVNISILDVEGEAMLLYLDEIGIQASTGSACTSTTLDPSHVIRALGCPYEVAHGSMRFTLGKYTKATDIKYVLKHLPDIIKHLRAASPVIVDMKEVDRAIKNAPRKIETL
ncbi:MAG: aminotransferase class V-fold PLP-dependent enzyme [Candidatus Komeilibacteria bacterium]|jgi:cysteine desulfurase|nr:aminotransferase class V-fold PLP-dependent enzyme [Candidatus Komeilibacteria bacterium]MBT4447367.1 aminotransferase class V-fold PLP-dependent enzyme [Candidatus Komeilibacteria bacterium]